MLLGSKKNCYIQQEQHNNNRTKGSSSRATATVAVQSFTHRLLRVVVVVVLAISCMGDNYYSILTAEAWSPTTKIHLHQQQRQQQYPSLHRLPTTTPPRSRQRHPRQHRGGTTTATTINFVSKLYATNNNNNNNYKNQNNSEDIYAAVHRKEYEMKQFHNQHRSTTDPIRMAMGYAQESVSNYYRLAAALRRVVAVGPEDVPPNDPNGVEPASQDQCSNTSNSESPQTTTTQTTTAKTAAAKTAVADKTNRDAQFQEYGLSEMSLRRGSFIVDIKRQSLSRPGETLCQFDDAGKVAQAMVLCGTDVVLINTDYTAYGGDISELKSAVRLVRQVSKTAAVVMKDIVVDEIQLGIAKESGADGILLLSSVLGPSLEHFLNLATMIGLETIVECHTKAEVDRALYIMAPNILVNNYDRITQQYYPNQAIQLAGLFPGSGGPLICLATGNFHSIEEMRQHLQVGYDGIVVGYTIMGNVNAAQIIRTVRDQELLPAEFSQWGMTLKPGEGESSTTVSTSSVSEFE
jgi:indole-3-glycerol phosphate synthase